MKQVTMESIRQHIADLESAGKVVGGLSLSSEFELACLRELVAVTEQRDAVVVECLSLKSAIIDIEDKYMNWEGLGDAFDAAKTTPTPATDKAISDRENDGGSK